MSANDGRQPHYAVVYDVIRSIGTIETQTVHQCESRQEAEQWIERYGEGGEYWIHLPAVTQPVLGSGFDSDHRSRA